MDVEGMTSDAHFATYMETVGRKSLAVVLYFLKDSAACTTIQPIFRSLSANFHSIKFIKVDADLCRATIQKHNIQVMPTFVLYKNMEPLQVIQGAKPLELEEVLRQQLAKERVEMPDVEVGLCMGPGGVGDLSLYVDPNRSECLNVSDLTPFSGFLARKNRLESDCDEQLILVYGFNQPVKIKSLKIKAPCDTGPKRLKLFMNQVASLDFNDVNQFTPTQEIKLGPEDLNGELSFELNQARFQNVTNLHIFIPENMGNTEMTEVSWMTIYGEPMTPAKGITGKTEQVVFLD